MLTIYAPATAGGRAAVGVIRISGPEAGPACRHLTGRAPPPARRASLRRLRAPGFTAAIDDALVLWFPGPASATGEDLLELQHHGGAAIVRDLLDVLAGLPGLRPAAAGEFTRRAFLAGRLDLAQAEAVADLVDASTRAQAAQALRQLDGEAGRRCARWRERLLDALARIEAEIDFGADELDVATEALGGLRPELIGLVGELRRAEAGTIAAARLRDGIVVAVVGPPNVGKSSLVNRLARRDVAIVTPVAGTTRDVLEAQLELGGVPVTLLDTAGLRQSDDLVERLGVERALRRAAGADLVVEVRACGEDPGPAAPCLQAPPSLVVLNKVDLLTGRPPPDERTLPVSCATGEGVDALVRALADAAAGLTSGEGDPAFTRARHRAALGDARRALERVLGAPTGAELALIAEDLRAALHAIAAITGAVGTEEVLDRVFATFCIGK